MHAEHTDRFIYGSETTHSFQTRGVYKTMTFRKQVDRQPNLTRHEIFNFNPEYNSSYDNAFVEHHNRFTLAYMRDKDWLAGEFRWTGMEGIRIPVWVYANQCDEVELFVNGTSCGRKPFDNQALYVSWDVAYSPGELRAVSYKAGKTVKETVIKTSGKPAAIELVPDKSEMAPNHRDVVHAQVRILDADGNVVPMAGNRIQFRIDGPAEILGVDNGDQLDRDPSKADNRKAFHGMCLALIQSGFETGDVTVHADADGLKGASCKLVVKGSSPEFSHRYTVPADINYDVSMFELKLNVPRGNRDD